MLIPRRVRRSTRVLLLVDFINPLQFAGARSILQPAFEAAQATAKLKERLAKGHCRSIYANDNYGI